MSDNDDPRKVPAPTSGDGAHALAKSVFGAIPFVGGTAAEAFNFIVQPPIEKRRQAWMTSVGERLKELEGKGVDLTKLQSDEAFISAVLHASTAAIRTHHEEKLEALRNAILNIAVGNAPDEAMQHLMLAMVDALTPLHLRVLKVFQKPNPPPTMGMGGLADVLVYNIPDLRGQNELFSQIWRDLYVRGLVSTEGLNVTMSGAGLAEKRTTGLGDALIRFISR